MESEQNKCMFTVLCSSLLWLILSATQTSGAAEIKLVTQPHFVVTESDGSIVKLTIEKTGSAVQDFAAYILLQGENTWDFFTPSVVASFPALGNLSKAVVLGVSDDDIPEADETFTFYLAAQGDAADVTVGNPKSVTVTILSNDNAFGVVAFNTSSPITFGETRGRNQSLGLVLKREKGTFGTVSVMFTVGNETNNAEGDVYPTKGKITFLPGQSTVVYNIYILDDQIPEIEEEFDIRLVACDGGASVDETKNVVRLIISKNDSPVRFSLSEISVLESVGEISVSVIRGTDEVGAFAGLDDGIVTINYQIISDGSSAAILDVDFLDLQANRTVTFAPGAKEAKLYFLIVDDTTPEIKETFSVVLQEDRIEGDAVLTEPHVLHVTIEANDKPYGVLSINNSLITQPLLINEDTTPRMEVIFVVRTGGTYGAVSVGWRITRGGEDPSPVTADLSPTSGVLQFADGERAVAVSLQVVQDVEAEEAEKFIFEMINGTAQGGAELTDPFQVAFFLRDSDDVYGVVELQPAYEHSIEGSAEGRRLTLGLTRQGGTRGAVRVSYTLRYLPPGVLEPSMGRRDVFNATDGGGGGDGFSGGALMPSESSAVNFTALIRSDAFLQSGAHLYIKLEKAELADMVPLVPPLSPRIGNYRSVFLPIPLHVANEEIGLNTNQTLFVSEPEDGAPVQITIPLQREGSDEHAAVFWSLTPVGPNQQYVSLSDIGPLEGSVTFTSGQGTSAINLTIWPDDMPEMDEIVRLTLNRVETERFLVYYGAEPDNQILKSGFTSREIVILQNDDPGGTFEISPFTQGHVFVKESPSSMVAVRVVRHGGSLLPCLLRYHVVPEGSLQFMGSNGILDFSPGDTEKELSLVPQADGIPELDETYLLQLSSLNGSACKVGDKDSLNITVLKNDDPHGVFVIRSSHLQQRVLESKGLNNHTAQFSVERHRGRFGAASVSWVVTPGGTRDVSPVKGTLLFGDQEAEQNITVQSLPDEIPEDNENFTITLSDTTGGASIGRPAAAILTIGSNDGPIYFKEPAVLRVSEGSVAVIAVRRDGARESAATVRFRTQPGLASAEDGDFVPVVEGLDVLHFAQGQTEASIYISTVDDELPEVEESFCVVLFDPTGDVVLHGSSTATLIIEANDDPNGLFSFNEPHEINIEEGSTAILSIVRERGLFGLVAVSWQLFNGNATPLAGEEFKDSRGTVVFLAGQRDHSVELTANVDNVPEFDETYTLKLTSVSSGFPGPGGHLARSGILINVTIPENDDPRGIFSIASESHYQEISEDLLSPDDVTNVASFTVMRRQGLHGDVRVAWEVLSKSAAETIPTSKDLILLATFPSEVQLRPEARRPHTGTDALYFSGDDYAFGIVPLSHQPVITNASFTISVWLIPDPNTKGYIVAKHVNSSLFYYSLKITTGMDASSIEFSYWHGDITQNESAVFNKQVEDGEWHHLIVGFEAGTCNFYLDGTLKRGGSSNLANGAATDGPGVLVVGAAIGGYEPYTGLMQDLRIYGRKLSPSEIHEVHSLPAKYDLSPVSGYLEYWEGEGNKSFIVEALNDNHAEGEEVYTLRLFDVRGGARVAPVGSEAEIVIEKSDFANGLFGFAGPCIPEVCSEGSKLSCIVERTRGDLDFVQVNFTVTQTDSQRTDTENDFDVHEGAITFKPMQTFMEMTLEVLDDDRPELMEHFEVALVAALSADGKAGRSPSSGASVDRSKDRALVAIQASDHPHGLLQFSLGSAPSDHDPVIKPVKSAPVVTVQEEVGRVQLLVVRTQGSLGDIVAGYRTVPLTATSPRDFQMTSGSLHFREGERYKNISVEVRDNSIPELPKSFLVQLLTHTTGDTEDLLDLAASGSGDGDSDSSLFVFNNSYSWADLDSGSSIEVIIDASDNAYGVFNFAPESLSVFGNENAEQSLVTLHITRSCGNLGTVTIYWKVDTDFDHDLVTQTGKVEFDVGQMVGNVSLQIADDAFAEMEETFTITLANVSAGRLGTDATSTLTVFPNDDPYGIFIFAKNSHSAIVQEELGNATLTIVRTQGLTGEVLVTFSTVEDDEYLSQMLPHTFLANEQRDYLATVASVIFKENQSEAFLSVPIVNDDEPERAETLLVRLLNVSLLKGDVKVVDPPRLGPLADTVARIVIAANDDANGVLQLSAAKVLVSEDSSSSFINVTRTGGLFGDITVKFKTIPFTARIGEDFTVGSSDVLFHEGETYKAVPVYIISDISPELEETFTIQLIDEITGGARLGAVSSATVTIEPSDDPFGYFVLRDVLVLVEEPVLGTRPVSLAVLRAGGSVGSVSLAWRATLGGVEASEDLLRSSGAILFPPGDTERAIRIDVLADDVPELQEVFLVELLNASNRGVVGMPALAQVIVAANDNPHGTVEFLWPEYVVHEPQSDRDTVNITLHRIGGLFGKLRIYVRTYEIGILELAQDSGATVMDFFEEAVNGSATARNAVPLPLHVNNGTEVLQFCAASCLQEQACLAFQYRATPSAAECFWMPTLSETFNDSTGFVIRSKKTDTSEVLMRNRALSGSDYEGLTWSSFAMPPGVEFVHIPIVLFGDDVPEMDEAFGLSISGVELADASADDTILPNVGRDSSCRVIIRQNDDPHGAFVLRSTGPQAGQDAREIFVEESPQSFVQIAVKREGGSIGDVNVTWAVEGGTALRNVDFFADDDMLLFQEGETEKIIELRVVDDHFGEMNETVLLALTAVHGGGRIKPGEGAATVVILANDNVAGMVGFHVASRAFIGDEGDVLLLRVERSAPAAGAVMVDWSMTGKSIWRNFLPYNGTIHFAEGALGVNFSVKLLEDGVPEEEEVYGVLLSNVRTLGMWWGGAAALDEQASEAVLTVSASNEPHGVIGFAPQSRYVSTAEGNTTITLFLVREFGSEGAVNVTYQTSRGSIKPLKPGEMALADPKQDYLHTAGFFILEEGQTSTSIRVTVLEDEIPEVSEVFLVNLTSVELLVSTAAGPPRLDIFGLVAQVVIEANDGAGGIISWKTNSIVVEEDVGKLTVVLQRGPVAYGRAYLLCYPQSLDAELGLDYIFTAGTLFFEHEEDIKVLEIDIVNDTIPEGIERFQLIITNPSPGVEIGPLNTATVTILANDDAHGILAFDSDEPVVLSEPVLFSVADGVARMLIVREPELGVFGRVSVRFRVTQSNSSGPVLDLTPSEGVVVLEDRVRSKPLEISAVIDDEPEMDEIFLVTLSSPTGGAVLGNKTQMTIRILRNGSPYGLLNIFASHTRSASVSVREGDVTVYMHVTRSQGLLGRVSVEWETQPGTAQGQRGDSNALATLQMFPEAAGWCSFIHDGSVYGVLLQSVRVRNASDLNGTELSTIYRWQGVFVPQQHFPTDGASTCVTLSVNSTPHVLISSDNGGSNLYAFLPDGGIQLLQEFPGERFKSVKHFIYEHNNYLICLDIFNETDVITQVYVWNGTGFASYQSLSTPWAGDMAMFHLQGISNLLVLRAQDPGENVWRSRLYAWRESRLQSPLDLAAGGTGILHVCSMKNETLLFVLNKSSSTELGSMTLDIYRWNLEMSSTVHQQTLLIESLKRINTFTASGGNVYLILPGSRGSSLFEWRTDTGLFEKALNLPAANDIFPLTVASLNENRTLLALAAEGYFAIYELSSIHHPSDFIPVSSKLVFEPMESNMTIAVTILEDDIPEDDEEFKIVLKHPDGGAEVGPYSQATITIRSNDDVHGVFGFSKESLYTELEELPVDQMVSFIVERQLGTLGQVSVHWIAIGDVNDITPNSGVVLFLSGQNISVLSLTVFEDAIPELTESISIQLSSVTVSGRDGQTRARIDASSGNALLNILANDSPFGIFGWHPESWFVTVEEPSENVSHVELKVSREGGSYGDVAVHYLTTVAGSQPMVHRASENMDFTATVASIILRENTTEAIVQIEILPDAVPELRETFYVNISAVELLGNVSGDSRPTVRRLGAELAGITVEENDEPHGFIQFNVTREISGVVLGHELPPPDNVLRLPVIRVAGHFGDVGLHWEARVGTASREDFTPASGTVAFTDGQAVGVIEVSIIDDYMFEHMETFSIHLILVTGGAKLGGDIIATINIPSNDSPFGLFAFEQTILHVQESRTFDDPDGLLEAAITRVHGTTGTIQVTWQLEMAARDDLIPLSGIVTFRDGDSRKTISLRTLPDSVLEGEETYTVQLVSAATNGEISATGGRAAIVISADPDAAGVISVASVSRQVFIGEPHGTCNGTAVVNLERGPGIFGEVSVTWRMAPEDGSAFAETSGTVLFENEQSAATIFLKALDDDIPELQQTFQLKLVMANGGARVNSQADSAEIFLAGSDYPHGKFHFSQDLIHMSEAAPLANASVVRDGGSLGYVRLLYLTVPGTATEGRDYERLHGDLVFEEGERLKLLGLKILNDEISEGPEDFYLNITQVQLISDGERYSAEREHGSGAEEPPALGVPFSLRVLIEKDDGAEGVIEFDSASGMSVAEEDGVLLVPLARHKGTYGSVMVLYVSRGVTAQPGGEDYLLPDGAALFMDGQNVSFINVSITDDDEREFEETFEIQLVSTTGGAVLGSRLIATITIAKSDAPNGLIGFLGGTRLIVPNPNVTHQLVLPIRRSAGLIGEQQVHWNILGPNGEQALSEENQDLLPPVQGLVVFDDGEGGEKYLRLQVLPHVGAEVTETFFIRLHTVVGGADRQPESWEVSLTILKHGDPNGVVQFTDQSLMHKTIVEPTVKEGPLALTFPITRSKGTMGDIKVYWEVQSDAGVEEDFETSHGVVTIPDMERDAAIILWLLPDDVAELDETFRVSITRVEGGAEIEPGRNSTLLTVPANGDPHGIFALLPNWQAVVSSQNVTRAIKLNMSRLAGAHDDVVVSYHVRASTGQDIGFGSITIQDGAFYGLAFIPILIEDFLPVGFTFVATLTNVRLASGTSPRPPRVHSDQNSVIITVTAEAANAMVGFDKTVLRVSNVSSGECEAVVSRYGKFGDVTVRWSSGFPKGSSANAFSAGIIIPPAGLIHFAHGQQHHSVDLLLMPRSKQLESFAVHITEVYSSVNGGAKIRQNQSFAKIEPFGVFQFDQAMQPLRIQEANGYAVLKIQRLYGYEGNGTRLTYQTISGSATPNLDFVPVLEAEVIFQRGQIEALIEMSVLDDDIPEPDEVFFVNLTGLSAWPEPDDPEHSPRLNPDGSSEAITIVANDDPHGVLGLSPREMLVVEDKVHIVKLIVRRVRGLFGTVGVTVRAAGSRFVPSLLASVELQHALANNTLPLATEGEDFESLDANVSLHEGVPEALVTLTILDDDVTEGKEAFFVYLTDPIGGASIATNDSGLRGYAKVIILGNDLQNGMLGFSPHFLLGVVLDEDSEESRSAELIIIRQKERVFDDVRVAWRATFDKDTVQLHREGVSLEKELEAVTGETVCQAGHFSCPIRVGLRPDKVPEIQAWFLLEIYWVGEGAAINSTSRFANVTVESSDHPHGLVLFAVGSRLMVTHQKSSVVTLRVVREYGISTPVAVHYRILELRRAEMEIGGVMIYPAIANQDFVPSEGHLEFQPGQREVSLDITLTPESASPNPVPKRFQVLLSSPTGGVGLDEQYNLANVTVVTDADTQFYWSLLDPLQQPVEEATIKRILQTLESKVGREQEASPEQLSACLQVLHQIISEGEKRALNESINKVIYNILCHLVDPSRLDTRGYTLLGEVTERFAFSLLTGIQCDSAPIRGKTMLDSCGRLMVLSARWYPQQINGHHFVGRAADSLALPERLLPVTGPSLQECYDVLFVEYRSQQWYQPKDQPSVMAGTVLSVGVKGIPSRPLTQEGEVTYRIHATDRRVVPHKSACLLWNPADEGWLADSKYCRVVEDSFNFVECACSHMSTYAVYGKTDNLTSYNLAVYISCIICMTGLALALLAHLLCSRLSMFAAKLLMHMLFACFATQVVFLIAAYVSGQVSDESCFAVGLIVHYFFLAQFTWILVQSINLWQVLVLNDEHTDRRFPLFVILGWGLPVALLVLLLIVLLAALGWESRNIYGAIHGDLCFVREQYVALVSAVLGPLVCLLASTVTLLHAYQLAEQWRSYDDVFRGKPNSSEVPLILYLFVLITLSWLWGGLHLAYRRLWMLILFVICNSLQGLYTLVVYAVLRNQLCWPVKTSYNLNASREASGRAAHPLPGSTYPEDIGDINKSTQNLITALEETQVDWPGRSVRQASRAQILPEESPQRGLRYDPTYAYVNNGLLPDEDSQDFDDLIFALKAGAGLSVSEDGSYRDSQDGGSIRNSQIVELKRIPIADTHL
ncbi:adhesion G-protein coupled receptor V1 isoform X2 [Petromyzon marinus]|uniref:adhesion G-protein coupled receptor V1 isoform X2 n=1 Tax=Petromyzon marinus TaxID=7757 RepID=UPI003F6FD733